MTSSPYADFLEQPDIKYYGGSEPSKCLLAMSETLCDLLVKHRIPSSGSRHIKLPGEKKLEKLGSCEVPSKMGD